MSFPYRFSAKAEAQDRSRVSAIRSAMDLFMVSFPFFSLFFTFDAQAQVPGVKQEGDAVPVLLPCAQCAPVCSLNGALGRAHFGQNLLIGFPPEHGGPFHPHLQGRSAAFQPFRKQDPSQERGSDTMGMKHFVRYGLYEIKGSINVQLAEKTGFSSEDANVVKECLRTLFVNDASSARPDGSMEVLKVFWWEHDCKDGQYSSAKVHRTLNVKLKEGIATPNSPEDYEIELQELPGLKCECIDGQ